MKLTNNYLYSEFLSFSRKDVIDKCHKNESNHVLGRNRARLQKESEKSDIDRQKTIIYLFPYFFFLSSPSFDDPKCTRRCTTVFSR